MTGLVELQRLFAACLDGSADATQAAHFHGLLATHGELAPEQRVGVYRGSSREARLRTLDAIFPVCLSVLGKRCFRGLASGYLDETPSLSGDLNLYGDAFPVFVERSLQTSDGLARLDYLADLARLECRWHAVYYASEDSPFDMEAFARESAGTSAEDIRFRLVASLRLLASDYPVHEIWRRHREGGDTGSVPLGGGDRLVIRRGGHAPQVQPVDPDLFELLAAIGEGRPLGALAADGLDLEPLPGLIATGWIAGFTAAGD
jgi:hypothetical protein